MNPAADAGNGAPAPARGRLRIAWRAIFGVLLLVGMAAGYWAMNRQKAAKQQEALHALRQAGAQVYLEYQWSEGQPVEGGRPPEAAWVRHLLGDAMFDRIVAVDLRSTHDLDAALAVLKWLPYLQHVDATGTGLSDPQLSSFGRLHALRSLDLSGTAITDQGISPLANLHQLRRLSLANTRITDNSVYTLVELKRLRWLNLSGTRFTSDGARRLRNALPRSEIVRKN